MISAGDAEVVEAVAAAAEAASRKHEGNKCNVVDSACAELLIEALQQPAVATSAGAVQAICGCLKSLTTADDARPVTSRCSFCCKSAVASHNLPRIRYGFVCVAGLPASSGHLFEGSAGHL